MGKRKTVETDPAPVAKATKERISLGELLSSTAEVQAFHFWVVGDTPLICHAWSKKAKDEMLKKQSGATRVAKEKRDPQQDFIDSLYDMGDGKSYGFPVTALKKATWSGAHKDRGVAKTDVQASVWLDAEVVSVRTALAGAICDLPLVRIFGDKPRMREDMVRIGTGLRKTANLAYRAQFTRWAIRATGTLDVSRMPLHQLVFLVKLGGQSYGIGDWRNEKGGWFGSYHLADLKEQAEWEKYAAGKGPLPKARPRGVPPLTIPQTEAAE
jgi:hypothetical protein